MRKVNRHLHLCYGYDLFPVLQDKDDDAILIGAHLCLDTFSSISLDAANSGVSYALYARQVLLATKVTTRNITFSMFA